MEASVWIISRMTSPDSVFTGRPRPETMPVVRVRSRPKGLPMASTFCPTRRPAELPKGMTVRGVPLGIELDHRQVVFRVHADDLALESAAVGQGDGELRASLTTW